MAEEILGKIIKLIENAALCVVMAEDGSDVLSREVLPVFREIAGITENRQEYIFKRINNVSAACIDYITGQQNSVKKDPDAAAAVNSGIAGIQEILNSPEEPVKTVFSEKLNIDDFFECVSDELAVIHSSLVRLSKIGKNSGRHKMEMFFKNLNTIVEKTADKKIPEKDKFETLIGMLVPACEEITGKKAGYETVFNTAKEDENDIPVNKGMIKDFLQKAEPGLDEAERGILIFEKEKDVKTLESFKNVLIFIKEDSAVLGIKETGRAAEEMLAYLKKADSLSADVLLEMRDRLYEMIKSQADKTEPDEKIKESAGSAPRAADEEPLQKNEEFYEFTGDMDLIGDFISEASEHAEIVDKSLLVLEKEKKNPEAINAVFRAFHTLKSLAGFLGLEDTHIMVKETENLLQNIRKETASPDPDVIDVLFASNDMLKKMIQNIKTGVGGSGRIKKAEGVPELVGRIKKLTGGEKKDPELSADSSEKEKEQEAGPADELFRGKEEQAGGGNIPSAAGTRLRETIKVDSEKLDRLIDTIGEIVIAESMIHSASDADESQILEFQKNMGHLNKTTKRLHEFGLSLRLVSLAGVFQKMARFVRDLSKSQGNKINFTILGEETEIDRNLAEKISDPLIHMIRNAVDHGIEPSHEREKAGKTETAELKLNAYHRGGNVCMEIEDDGRGLNKETIIQRAKAMSLMTDEETLSDREIYNFIFKPGFSTASVVTDTSGRGVGMDVVKRNIQEMRGRIEIHTEKTKGTKFVISLPLTTAIIEAMLITINGGKYFMPTLAIVESSKAQRKDITFMPGGKITYNFRDTVIPLYSAGEFFAGKKEEPENYTEKIIVVAEDENGKPAGILVDEIIEQYQIVVKPMGEGIDPGPGVGGCTIMSDGKVGLIIDPAGMFKDASGGNTGKMQTKKIPAIR